ncbi:MAG: glycine betaine/proline transport system substrate-binding protein [Pseudonocardiales bacterium]|jgi:glycine betaine/proline transport system substrate-binding protein|nr:glycine betaine/proline transport system substrate-binding protein [Pseudonocardiales bacterium]
MARWTTRLTAHRSAGRLTAAVLGMAMLAGCGGAKVGGTTSDAGVKTSGAAKTSACGTFNIADNPWVGYEADVAVVGYVARTKLNCKVVVKHITEQVSWQGFSTGQVDAILENWGHDDLKKQYIDDTKVAQDLGSNGLKGVIGWFVPPWMATKYPDITDWKNLNKYADLFKTSESGGKGQLLDGDPSYVTNDAALVKNLGLNYKVVQGGSETALIQSFRSAQQNKTPLLAYFYSPQWFLNEVQLVKVNLPAYTAGCDANAAKVACDYPAYDLNKIASVKFANSGSPAYSLVKNFTWTNEDQNVVAKYLAVDKLSDDAAAQKWVDAHPDKVNAWLKSG